MGKRFDVEMQTLYKAESNEKRRLSGLHDGSHEHADVKAPWAASVSVLFDRVNYDPLVTASERATVDKFFDSLVLDSALTDKDTEGNAILVNGGKVPYGDLMNSLNFANRWAYNGSFTEAPCD